MIKYLSLVAALCVAILLMCGCHRANQVRESNDKKGKIISCIEQRISNTMIFDMLSDAENRKYARDYIATQPYYRVKDLVYDLLEDGYKDAVPVNHGIQCCIDVMVAEYDYNVNRYERYYGYVIDFGNAGQKELLNHLSESHNSAELTIVVCWFVERYHGPGKPDIATFDDSEKNRKILLPWLTANWNKFKQDGYDFSMD